MDSEACGWHTSSYGHASITVKEQSFTMKLDMRIQSCSCVEAASSCEATLTFGDLCNEAARDPLLATCDR